MEKTPQYDAGAYRFGRAVEVLEAKRSAERRALLEERYRKACGEVGAEPLSDAEWRSLWARRMLFLQDFERDDDWSGKIIEEEEGRHLQGATDNRWFGRFIRVGVNYDHARAAAQTWIRFRYRVARPGPIQVMLFDLTQKDNYRYRIEPSVVGAWTEVELDVTGAFTRADGSLSRMAAGDAIDDIHLAHVACRVRRRHEFRGPDHVRTRLDDETDERE